MREKKIAVHQHQQQQQGRVRPDDDRAAKMAFRRHGRTAACVYGFPATPLSSSMMLSSLWWFIAVLLSSSINSNHLCVGAAAVKVLTALAGPQLAPQQQQQQHRTILVTGGAGFVGSHLADALLERGDRVVIVDEVNDYYDVKIKEGNLRMLQEKYNPNTSGDNNEPDEPDNDDDNELVTIYRGDLCNRTVLDEVFARHQFDAIAHMAARAGVRPSILDPFIYVHSNIKATIALLDRAVRYNVSTFVFASSSSVYGGSTSTYFSEAEQVDHPISPYAATKKSCELFAYAYHRQFGINTAALRFFTVYGPRGRPDMAVWKFIDRVSNGKIIQQYGDGSSSRDYTYVADIVRGVVGALDRPLGYRIYNLGKGSGTPLHELLRLVETQVGQPARVEILPDQPGDVPYTCANISLAFNDLGYNATVLTNVGVAKTVEWYLATYPPPPPNPSSSSSAAASTASGRRRRLVQSSQLQDESWPTTWLDDAIDQDGVSIEHRRRRKLLSSSTAVERNDERKTVLVTGGTRFLGSHVVDALLDRGDRVVLVDDMELTEQSRYNLNLLLQQYGESGRVMVHLGNLTDVAFLRAVFDTEAPGWVCHVAVTVEDSRSFDESLVIVEQTIDPTLHLLDLAKGKRHGGFDVENFVIVGSSAVYGDRTANNLDQSSSSSLLLDEEDRVDAPLTPYAASKKSEELLAYTYHHLYDIPISILRVDAMFGPRHDLRSKSFDHFHTFLQNVTSLSFSVTAEDHRFVAPELADHWVYVGDVVTALLSTLDHRHGYEIFNVGGRNCPQTLHSVFRTMDSLLLDLATGAQSPQGKPCLSMEKVKQMLQFKPSVTLLEGVMKTIQWHRELFDYSRVSPAASARTMNPFTSAAAAARTRSNNRIRNSYSVVRYPYPAVTKVRRSNWALMRDLACFQWAIVVVVVLFRYRPSTLHTGKIRRGRSPPPTL